jgi:predicted deacylase
MLFIESYGQINGEHHKYWLLDQIAQIIKGTPIIVTQVSWSNGESEYRFQLGQKTQQYEDWRIRMKGHYDEETEEYEYDYNEGVPC